MLKEMTPKGATEPEAPKEDTKRWLQMGAELEGSWPNRKTVAGLARGARAVEDRSVHIGHGDPGEIITRPHESLDDLIADLTTLWPPTVNDSCGFHVHASFTPLDGSIIATKDFYRYFKEQWQIWGTKEKLDRAHEFWGRLAGRNKFAKDVFDPEAQLRGYNGAPQNDKRYTLLNFYAWEKHKTIECRLLPMFTDVSLAISATRWLSHIYNSYLNKHGFSTITMEPSVTVVGDEAREMYEMQLPKTAPMSFEAEGSFPSLPAGEDIFYSIAGAEHQMFPFSKETKETTP